MIRQVEEVFKSMKWRKTEGSDGVIVEMVEIAGEFAVDKNTNLASVVNSTGPVPENMKESEVIINPKKNETVDCSTHKAISVMSQIAITLLKVIDERLKIKHEERVDKAQFSFRIVSGTRNATFILINVMERVVEKQKHIFICFIYFERAFDSIRHEKLMDRQRSWFGCSRPEITYNLIL